MSSNFICIKTRPIVLRGKNCLNFVSSNNMASVNLNACEERPASLRRQLYILFLQIATFFLAIGRALAEIAGKKVMLISKFID